MTETKKRIIMGVFMAVVALAAAGLQYAGLPAVRWLGILVILTMMYEFASAAFRNRDKIGTGRGRMAFGAFSLWLILMLYAMTVVGNRPWIVLLLLLIICAADIGAWFFGRLIGGDKMWESLSAKKTWAGQIAGILCGTAAAVMYGLLGTDTFMPQLMWIGISVSLMSQYGDLTASWFKRRLGIKDFGNLIPGHGGMLDRFDGWIYVLPIIWLVML